MCVWLGTAGTWLIQTHVRASRLPNLIRKGSSILVLQREGVTINGKQDLPHTHDCFCLQDQKEPHPFDGKQVPLFTNS